MGLVGELEEAFEGRFVCGVCFAGALNSVLESDLESILELYISIPEIYVEKCIASSDEI